MDEVKHHADANAGIGDVERRVNVAAEVQVDEIDHVTVHEPVGEIADDAAAEQTETHLHEAGTKAERPPPQEYRQQRHGSSGREDGALT